MSVKAIDKYVDLQSALRDSNHWVSMLGKRYSGGGGGIGALHSLSLNKGEASPTLYYQESNGSTNYHRMPVELSKHLESAIKSKFTELIADALKLQEKELKKCANAAVEEHKRLLESAGIDIGESQNVD